MEKSEKTAVGIFKISGISCGGGNCIKRFKKELYKLDGVLSIGINYFTDKLYVEYDPLKISLEEIKKVVGKSG